MPNVGLSNLHDIFCLYNELHCSKSTNAACRNLRQNRRLQAKCILQRTRSAKWKRISGGFLRKEPLPHAPTHFAQLKSVIFRCHSHNGSPGGCTIWSPEFPDFGANCIQTRNTRLILADEAYSMFFRRKTKTNTHTHQCECTKRSPSSG